MIKRGHGTYVDQEEVIASVSGTIERVNKLITVRALRTRFGGHCTNPHLFINVKFSLVIIRKLVTSLLDVSRRSDLRTIAKILEELSMFSGSSAPMESRCELSPRCCINAHIYKSPRWRPSKIN